MGVTAKDVQVAIKRKFCAPEWACYFEVRNDAGMRANRSADAIAMNLFPSRGLEMHGMEVKVSRSDWLSELKDASKADAFVRFCDRWWIVTPPDIVRDGELPPTWGHYILKGSGLHCAVKAPKLERAPWDAGFIASLLRRGHEDRERDIRDGISAAMSSERQAISAEVAKRVAREVEEKTRLNGDAIRALDTIKQKCGLPTDDGRGWRDYFDAEGFAAAVALVYQLGITRTYSNLDSAARAAAGFADELSRLRPAVQVPA